MIKLGVLLVIFYVMKRSRFFDWLNLDWLPDDLGAGKAGYWDGMCAYRDEAVGEPSDAIFTSDGRMIVD